MSGKESEELNEFSAILLYTHTKLHSLIVILIVILIISEKINSKIKGH